MNRGCPERDLLDRLETTPELEPYARGRFARAASSAGAEAVVLALLIGYLTLSILSVRAVVLIVVTLPAGHFTGDPTGAPGSRTTLRRPAVVVGRNASGLLLDATGLPLSVRVKAC